MYATLGVSCGHVGGALTSNHKFFRLKEKVYELGPTQTSQYPVCNTIKHNQHGDIYEPQKADVAGKADTVESATLVGGKGGIHPLAWSEVCKSCKSCPACKTI